MTDDGRPGRTLDEALLRVVTERLGTLTLVERVTLFPQEKPESAVVEFDDHYYPDEVHGVALEVRAYTNGDFYVVYREEWTGDSWMCRWDRHENPHSARDHFHEPPAAEASDAVDRSFSTDFLDVLETVLGDIDDRIGAAWDEVGRR